MFSQFGGQLEVMIKIHLMNKVDLSYEDSFNVIEAGMSNTNSMTISHYPYSNKTTEATLPYEIEITGNHVPYAKEVEFCVVLRTKVDLTAIGPNERIIKDNGKDIGKYRYHDVSPQRPHALPQGFIEKYNGNG